MRRLFIALLFAASAHAQLTFWAIITPPGKTALEWHQITIASGALTTPDGGKTFTLALPGPSAAPAWLTGIAQPPDVAVNADGTLTIGRSCSLLTPCAARVNGVFYPYTASATVTVLNPGASNSAQPMTEIRIYISDGSDNAPPGTWQVVWTGGISSTAVTCDVNCTALPGAQFSGLPLAQYTPGAPLADKRAILAAH